MTNANIKKVLQAHNIHYLERGHDLYGITPYTTEDGKSDLEYTYLTGLTKAQLLSYLNY